MAIAPLASAGLRRGSHWRAEVLDLRLTDGVEVAAYGPAGAAAPIIDGSKVIVNGSFTATGGQPNVYQAGVSHIAEGEENERVRVWVDGVALPRAASLAACSSTPGTSFSATEGEDLPGTNPVTVHVHPPGSTNPATDGKLYEVAVGRRLLDMEGHANGTVRGLYVRRIGGETGVYGGPNALIERVVAAEGHKHNVALEYGTVRDTISLYGEPGDPYGDQHVAYADAPTGTEEVLWERCGAIGHGSAVVESNMDGWLAHTASGASYDFRRLMWRQCWAVGLHGSAITPEAESYTILGFYGRDLGDYLMRGIGPFTASYVQCESAILLVPAALTAGQVVTVRDSVVYDVNAVASHIENTLGTGGIVRLRNCVVYATNSTRTIDLRNGFTLDMEDCLVVVGRPGDTVQPLYLRATATPCTFLGDRNVYCVLDGGTGHSFHYRGTDYTFANWKAATGEDDNSILITETQLGTLLAGDPSDGDFSLDPDCALAFVNGDPVIETLGPRNHWDWNARAVAAGPPTAWPDVPDSLADALAYQKDPAGWAF